MKKSYAILMVILVALFTFSACGKEIAPPSLERGKIHITGESRDASGETIIEYEDDEYEYRYNREREMLASLIMKTELREAVVADSTASLESVKPEIDPTAHIAMLFPSCSIEELEFELTATGSGNPLESRMCRVTQRDGDILVNIATLSYARNGELTMAYRSCNTMPESISENVDEEMAAVIAEKHLSAENGFDDFSAEKMIYKDTVVWHVECRIEQGVMDTYATMYIDIESGAPLDCLVTSAE